MKIEEYIIEKLSEEFNCIDIEEETKDMLDETYSFANIGGPFQYMSAGDVLEQYDHVAFREEVNNYLDLQVQDNNWVEYNDRYWHIDAKHALEEYRDILKDCDPFHVSDGKHPGWYYYDKMAFVQGPFNEPYDCYNHAIDQYYKI